MKTSDVDKIPPLTLAQRKLIVALVEHRTIASAARAAGVARTAYYRWQEDPNFRAEVSRVRRHQVEEGLELLTAGMAKAVGRMLEALDDKDRSLRLKASVALTQFGIDVVMNADRERRLSELEERAGLPRLK